MNDSVLPMPGRPCSPMTGFSPDPGGGSASAEVLPCTRETAPSIRESPG